MAHIEIKTIKNHDYVYVRQSYRIGDKIRHKHIAYLGAVSPIRLIAIAPSAPIIPIVPSVPSGPRIISKISKKRLPIRIKGLPGKGYIETKDKQDKQILIRKFKKKIKKKIIKKKLKELKKGKKEKSDSNDNLFEFFNT